MNKHLPLSAIQRRDYLQQRTPNLIEDKHDFYRQSANLNSTIEDIKSDLRNGQSIRIPLEVHEVEGEFLLVDGHHRLEAIIAHCKETHLEISTYQVLVKITPTSTLQAAITASFSVNLDHGVGLTSKERIHTSFRQYVWNCSVPKQAEIRSATGCSKGTASNIANAAQWCIDKLNLGGINATTPIMLKSFMTKQMTLLGINEKMLDVYGLPSYSLLRKVLKGDNYLPDEVPDEHELYICLARQEIEKIESKYGVESLREGLRRHKTNAYDIKISQHKLWIKKTSTADLLATQLAVPASVPVSDDDSTYNEDDF